MGGGRASCQSPWAGISPTRRTFVKLALKGQARFEQIQVTLGHATIQTTQRYLDTELDLHDARQVIACRSALVRSEG